MMIFCGMGGWDIVVILFDGFILDVVDIVSVWSKKIVGYSWVKRW